MHILKTFKNWRGWQKKNYLITGWSITLIFGIAGLLAGIDFIVKGKIEIFQNPIARITMIIMGFIFFFLWIQLEDISETSKKFFLTNGALILLKFKNHKQHPECDSAINKLLKKGKRVNTVTDAKQWIKDCRKFLNKNN